MLRKCSKKWVERALTRPEQTLHPCCPEKGRNGPSFALTRFTTCSSPATWPLKWTSRKILCSSSRLTPQLVQIPRRKLMAWDFVVVPSPFIQKGIPPQQWYQVFGNPYSAMIRSLMKELIENTPAQAQNFWFGLSTTILSQNLAKTTFSMVQRVHDGTVYTDLSTGW